VLVLRRKRNDNIRVQANSDINILTAARLMAMNRQNIIGIGQQGGLSSRIHGYQTIARNVTGGTTSQHTVDINFDTFVMIHEEDEVTNLLSNEAARIKRAAQPDVSRVPNSMNDTGCVGRVPCPKPTKTLFHVESL
jgi:hypothetical protein